MTPALVLVVDDDERMRRVLAELARREGAEAICAASAERALELLDESTPTLALIDVTLPGLDGLALCRCLRQDPRCEELPVILVSGRVEPGDVEAGVAAGAVDYVKKPFDPDELRFRLRAQLRLREARNERRRAQERLAAISRAA